jgi:single-strand DNA-binding protein
MNHILVAGHLGADPEVRFTSSGQKVTTLRVASNVRKGGKDETVWWKITIWGDQFDKIIPYFKKGSPIIVTGELAKPEIFTDRDGKPQISLNITANNITFSPFGKSDQKGEEGASGFKQPFQKPEIGASQGASFAESGAFQPTQTMYGQRDVSEFNDEEIPF